MTRLLFWNLKKNLRLLRLLGDVIRERDVDVIVTAENPLEPRRMAKSLSEVAGQKFVLHSGKINKRITVFASKSIKIGPPIAESKYLVVYPFNVGPHEVLLASIHGISRLENELEGLNEEACNAAEFLRDTEVARKHRRTVLIGDFNLNPFDRGMATARGFYGVMSRADAARKIQRLNFREYPLFYNPMWSRLGDESPGPPGSYYRSRTEHLSYYWHTYDQVLIRPELFPCFDARNLEVLTRIGSVELLRNRIPDAENLSDHLPVLIGLELSKIEGA